MKILMINVVCGIRSTGRICTDLATVLEKQGHEVKIAYGREKVPEQYQKYAVRIGSELDIKLHVLKARIQDKAGFGSKRATENFIKWVKKYDPDVIHLHNIHGYYINVKILFEYLKTCGKRIIWTLHDYWALTGHAAYCDAIKCEKWKTGCRKCPQIKEYPKSFIDNSKNNWKKKRRIFTNVPNMTIVTPSEWLANIVKHSYLDGYKVKVIYNGIDTSRFIPLSNDFRQYYSINRKYMILGLVTAKNGMKHLSGFIELSQKIDDKCIIVLVGLTEKQLDKLPANIIGIERTTSVKELSKIYSAADIIVDLTHCDSVDWVKEENEFSGTPVISYNVVSCRESKHRIIVEQGNLGAIIKALDIIEKNDDSKNICIDDSNMKQYCQENLEFGGGYWKIKDKYKLIGKTVILGVAAIWDTRKGLNDMIYLSKILDDDYQIVLVGLNEEQIKKIPSNIRTVRATDSIDELAKLYSIADYFVNPTYEDNYPTTNLEAISCNTPVLTYDTGGSPESARMYGKIFEQGKIELIGKQIKSSEILEKDSMNIDKNATVDRYLEIFKVQT